MLASVSKVLSQDMVQHLPTIIPRMIESLSCDEGIQVSLSFSLTFHTITGLLFLFCCPFS